jgi:hypothetical protein
LPELVERTAYSKHRNHGHDESCEQCNSKAETHLPRIRHVCDEFGQQIKYSHFQTPQAVCTISNDREVRKWNTNMQLSSDRLTRTSLLPKISLSSSGFFSGSRSAARKCPGSTRRGKYVGENDPIKLPHKLLTRSRSSDRLDTALSQ